MNWFTTGRAAKGRARNCSGLLKSSGSAAPETLAARYSGGARGIQSEGQQQFQRGFSASSAL
eukprot:15217058-Alexandrium_andersonii.AAC.1